MSKNKQEKKGMRVNELRQKLEATGTGSGKTEVLSRLEMADRGATALDGLRALHESKCSDITLDKAKSICSQRYSEDEINAALGPAPKPKKVGKKPNPNPVMKQDDPSPAESEDFEEVIEPGVGTGQQAGSSK